MLRLLCSGCYACMGYYARVTMLSLLLCSGCYARVAKKGLLCSGCITMLGLLCIFIAMLGSVCYAHVIPSSHYNYNYAQVLSRVAIYSPGPLIRPYVSHR